MKAVMISTALAVLLATPALAQNARNCGDHANVIARLAEGYGETRKSMGLGANNSLVELYASEETGTWTITVTTPHGLTCLVASGQSFERIDESLPEDTGEAL